MRGRRLWAKTADGLRIYVKKGPVVVDGDDSYAEFDPEKNAITVRLADIETMHRKLVHEFCHKSLHSIPGGKFSGIFGEGLTTEEAHDREENLCEWLETRLYDVIKDFLRFPKPPRFDK